MTYLVAVFIGSIRIMSVKQMRLFAPLLKITFAIKNSESLHGGIGSRGFDLYSILREAPLA